jgi:hypothetical protein
MAIDFWPSTENGEWACCECGGSMGADYEPPTCCSGHECGCMGMPTEPNVCSEKCWISLDNNTQ